MIGVNFYKDSDGVTHEVADDERDELGKVPDGAARSDTFTDEAGKLYAVPENERSDFMRIVPTARPALKVKTINGEKFGVPIDEMGDFLRAYRTEDRFKPDRDASRAKAEEAAARPLNKTAAIIGGAVRGATLDAPKWWKETLRQLPKEFSEGVNQSTAMGTDGDAVLGFVSEEQADSMNAAYNAKGRHSPDDDMARGWIREAAKMSGQQVRPIARALGTAGAVGLGAGATGVGAPAAIPAATGAFTVALQYSFMRQGMGEIYREARNQGLPHDTARLVGFVGGVPFGALEGFQLGRLAQGFTTKSIRGSVVKRVVRMLTAAGVRTVEEAGAEGLQEITKQASVTAGKIVEGELSMADIPAETLSAGIAGVEEFVNVIGPMAVMQIPGFMAGSYSSMSDKVASDSIKRWARENPKAAAAVTATDAPTRKVFEEAGLPRVNAETRSEIAAELKSVMSEGDVMHGPSLVLDNGKTFAPSETVPAGSHQVKGETVMLEEPTLASEVVSLVEADNELEPEAVAPAIEKNNEAVPATTAKETLAGPPVAEPVAPVAEPTPVAPPVVEPEPEKAVVEPPAPPVAKEKNKGRKVKPAVKPEPKAVEVITQEEYDEKRRLDAEKAKADRKRVKDAAHAIDVEYAAEHFKKLLPVDADRIDNAKIPLPPGYNLVGVRYVHDSDAKNKGVKVNATGVAPAKIEAKAPEPKAAEPTKTDAAAKPEVRRPLRMDGTTRPERATQKPILPFGSLPEKSRTIFNTAFDQKDAEGMAAILHKENRVLRAEFETRTGVKLPKTQRDTKTAINEWAAPKLKNAQEPAAKPKAAELAKADVPAKTGAKKASTPKLGRKGATKAAEVIQDTAERTVDIGDGRVVTVRGEGAATYWSDPSNKTGPYAGKFVLASPDFRSELEAAEKAAPAGQLDRKGRTPERVAKLKAVAKATRAAQEPAPKIKGKKVAVTPPVASQVKIETEPDGDKVVSVPKVDRPGLPLKEQKKYLLAEIDKAIEGASDGFVDAKPDVPRYGVSSEKIEADAAYMKVESVRLANIEKFGQVVIEVPGDGTFSLLNEKSVLENFKKEAKKFPVKSNTAPRPEPSGQSSLSAVPKSRPTKVANVEKIMQPMVSVDKTKEVLTQLHSDGEKGSIFATDGRRLAVSLGMKVKTSKHMISERIKDNLTGKMIESTYPNYELAIPHGREGQLPDVAKYENRVEVDTEPLLRKLAQANTAIDASLSGDKKTGSEAPSVNLYLMPDGSIEIASNNVDTGEYVSADVSGGTLVGTYRNDYVKDGIDFLRRMGNSTVTLAWNEGNSPSAIVGKNEFYVLMPLGNVTAHTPIVPSPSGLPSGVGAASARKDPQEFLGGVKLPKTQRDTKTAINEWAAPKLKNAQEPAAKPTDAAYMAAVEAGDTETAQKMVDEAAKAAGYNIGPVWHGGPSGISEFMPSDADATVGRGVSFAPKKSDAELYASMNGRGKGGVTYGAFLRLENPAVTRVGEDDYDAAVSKASDAKYDGMIVRDVNGNITEYSVRNPSQIKSADAVTRDDSGNVIPLSQRFNETNDIRGYAPPAPKIKGKKVAVTPQVADQVKIETEPDGDKVVSVPKVDRPGLPLKEQKKYLLAEIDKAIATKPTGNERVKFNVPGDGEYTLSHNIDVLEEFRRRVKSTFPVNVKVPSRPTVKGGTPRTNEDRENDRNASADYAIGQYGDAKTAAKTIRDNAAQAVAVNDEDPKAVEMWLSVASVLEDRAKLTNVPADQKTDRIEEVRNAILQNQYDVEKSEALQESKAREARAVEAMRKSPLYEELDGALRARNDVSEMPEDGDLLNVQVSGRGAPVIREIQDKLAGEIGLYRIKNNDKTRRRHRYNKGPAPLSFNLSHYWQDVAQEYKPEIEQEDEGAASGLPSGVGAASARKDPQEFFGDVSGVKHAYVDVMRERLGKHPRTPTETRHDDSLLNEVESLYETNPSTGRDLIDAFKADDRKAPSDRDTMILLRETVMAESAANESRSRDTALANSGDTAAIEENATRMAAAETRLDGIFDILDRSGTEAGRALRARRFMMDSDFNLIRMEYIIKKAQGGKKLSPELMAELRQLKKDKAESSAARAKEEARVQAETDEFNEELRKAADRIAYAEMVAAAISEGDTPFRNKMLARSEMLKARGRAKIKALSGRASIGVDPEWISALADLGAGYILEGVVSLSDWVTKMRADVPDITDADLETVRTAAFGIAEAERDSLGKKKGKKEGKKSAPPTKGDATNLGAEAKALFREQAENGVDTLDKALHNVHAIMVKSDSTLTPEHVRDLFSDYGKSREANRDTVSKILADLRRQSQLLASIERVRAKLRPKKTGQQRDKPTPIQRELQRKLNALMKEAWITARDSEAELASALDAVKTRLTNSIADMQKAIDQNKRLVADKSGVEYDDEAKALEARRDSLREQYDAMFPTLPLTPEQRINAGIRQAERSLDDWNRKLVDARSGKFGADNTGRSSAWNERISYLKIKAAKAKAEVAKLKELARPIKDPIQAAIDAKRKRIEAHTKMLRDRIQRNDFAPRKTTRINISGDPAALAAQAVDESVRERFNALKERARWLTLNPYQMGGEILLAGYDVSRNIAYSGDDSFLGRQGFFYAMSHPIKLAKAGVKSVGAMSQKKSQKIGQQFVESFMYTSGLMDKAKVEYDKPDASGNYGSTDETFRLNLTRGMPVMGQIVDISSRSFATAANEIRGGFTRLLLEDTKTGREILANPHNLTKKQQAFLEDIGWGVNVLTGRGHVSNAQGFSRWFGAPRWFKAVLSEVLHLPILRPLARGDTEAAVAFAKQYARVYTTLAAIYGIYYLFRGGDDDDKVVWDLRSSKFGAMRLGKNFYWNPLQTVSPLLRFMARVISGQKVNSAGKVVNLRQSWLPFATDEERKNKVPYREGQVEDAFNFVRTKLHPGLNAIGGGITGQDFQGNETPRLFLLLGAFSPITFGKAYEAYSVTGVAEATAVTLSEFFGVDTRPDYKDVEYKKYQSREKVLKDVILEALRLKSSGKKLDVMPGPSLMLDDGRTFAPTAIVPAGSYQVHGETVMLESPTVASKVITLTNRSFAIRSRRQFIEDSGRTFYYATAPNADDGARDRARDVLADMTWNEARASLRSAAPDGTNLNILAGPNRRQTAYGDRVQRLHLQWIKAQKTSE